MHSCSDSELWVLLIPELFALELNLVSTAQSKQGWVVRSWVKINHSWCEKYDFRSKSFNKNFSLTLFLNNLITGCSQNN